MNPRIERMFAWTGVASIVIVGIGFAVLAPFLPPPSPDHDAQWVADYFRKHEDGIKWGMIVMQFGACLLGLFIIAIFLQVRRIEGAHALAYVVLAMGAVLTLQFIYIDFIWQAAAFRSDRDPDSVLALYDLAFLPFLGAGGPLLFLVVAFSLAILIDKRERPAFPRWLGYFGLWVALASVPGEFTVLFKTGPMAWDGAITFWLAVGVFGAWMIVNSIYLVKSVDIAVEEDAAAASVAATNGAGRDVTAEIEALKAQVERLTTRVG